MGILRYVTLDILPLDASPFLYFQPEKVAIGTSKHERLLFEGLFHNGGSTRCEGWTLTEMEIENCFVQTSYNSGGDGYNMNMICLKYATDKICSQQQTMDRLV